MLDDLGTVAKRFLGIFTWFDGWFEAIESTVTDPILAWGLKGALAIMIAGAAAWFFGALPVIGPAIRAIAGAVIFIVIEALWAYREGEEAERARHQPAKATSAKPKAAPEWGPPKWGDW